MLDLFIFNRLSPKSEISEITMLNFLLAAFRSTGELLITTKRSKNNLTLFSGFKFVGGTGFGGNFGLILFRFRYPAISLNFSLIVKT